MELTPTGDDGVYSMDILLELEETTPKTDYLDANKYQEGLTPDKLKDVDMSQQVLITDETNESEDAFKIPEGYECTVNDHAFIEAAKKISAEPGREELVLIDDVLVNRNHMECLFCRNAYLYDEVITPSTNLWEQKSFFILRNYSWPSGTCYLENTSMTVLMKGDGEEKRNMEDMEDHYPSRGHSQVPRLAERVLSYMQHDMYLAVVNARRRKIHLKGFRMQMEYTLQCTGLKDHAWPDVNVDIWDVVEVMVDRIQFDGVSCGLFMVAFIKYWTGDHLCATVDQESMVKFRTKMAATLLSTIFNERLGKPLLRNEDENIGSPSDFAEIIEPNEFQQIKQKRKSTNSHENALKPKKIDTEIDSDKQDVLLYYKDWPLKRDELAEIFCDYILTIKDPAELDMVWIRSDLPYRSVYKLGDLKVLLKRGSPMPEPFFNLGKMLELTHHENYRKHHSGKELGDVIGGWEIVKYDILGCRYFLLPWKHVNTYLLYVLDIKRKKLIVIDTKPIPKYAMDVPYKHYAIQIVGFCLKFMNAFRQLKPDSWEDVHKWEFERVKGIVEDTDG
uniref:Ubiquitin-like protease family profile domain-containing protein n=1 Tax=Setaria italica TaxID=4555 RepID=K3XSH8_SETIT